MTENENFDLEADVTKIAEVQEEILENNAFEHIESNAVEEVTQSTTVKIRRKKKKEPKEKHLQGVVRFARKFSSTGAAFVLATLGVVTQTFHNGFLAFELSSFSDFWLRLFQAIIAAFFLSGALLYFTIRAADGIESAKKLVWYFAIFEVICNLYYWANKLIILEWSTDKGPIWSSMLIAIPFSFMIPWSIKAYASEIRLNDDDEDIIDEYEEFEVEVPAQDVDLTEISTTIDEKITSAVKSQVQDNMTNAISYGDSLDFAIATTDAEGKKVNKILKATLKKN